MDAVTIKIAENNGKNNKTTFVSRKLEKVHSVNIGNQLESSHFESF